MKPTLLIMAAGMGSRYGALKQLDGIGPNNETILDYSIYDAKKAGFGKIVFVIRKSFEKAFREQIVSKVEKHIKCECVFQELDCLPKGYSLPEGREKPWGTAHAILVAKDVINEPFAAINADDFYSYDAFDVMYKFLSKLENNSTEFSMVGYKLANTLSESGSVSRGVCKVDDNNNLVSIQEHTKITKVNNTIEDLDSKDKTIFNGDEIVSMNFWGFTPIFFDFIDKSFIEFLETRINEPKSELYIPSVVFENLKAKKCDVKVLESSASWFGVTYKEDKELVVNKLNNLIKKGIYPSNLWG